jgi:hypothetical protein
MKMVHAMDNLFNSVSGDTVPMSSYWLAHFYFDGKSGKECCTSRPPNLLGRPKAVLYIKTQWFPHFLHRLVRKEVDLRLLSVLLRIRGLDYD